MRRLWLSVVLYLFFLSQLCAGVIKVGSTLSLTGPYSEVARDILDGYTLAFEEERFQKGLSIEFLYYDDGLNPVMAASNAERLVGEDGVDVVFGVIGDSTSLYVARVLNLRKRVLFSPYTSLDVLFNPRRFPYVFMVRPSCKNEIASLIPLISKLKRLGVLYFSRSLSGIDCMKTLLTQVRVKGVELLSFGVGSKADLISAARKMKSAGIEAVYVTIPFDFIGEFVKNLVMLKYFPALYVGGSMSTADVVKFKEVGDFVKSAEFYLLLPFPLPSEDYGISRSFQDAFERYSNKKSYSYYTFVGYITAKVLLRVLSELGSAEKLREGIESLGPIDIGLPEVIHYTPVNHTGFTKIYVYRVTPEGIRPVE